MNALGDIRLWLIIQKPVSFSASFVKQLATASGYVYLFKVSFTMYNIFLCFFSGLDDK